MNPDSGAPGPSWGSWRFLLAACYVVLEEVTTNWQEHEWKSWKADLWTLRELPLPTPPHVDGLSTPVLPSYEVFSPGFTLQLFLPCPVLLPFSFFHLEYTWLCPDNSSLSQRAWDGQQCILPSPSWLDFLIIFLLLLSVLFMSFFGKAVYIHTHTRTQSVFTQRPAPGNHILSRCCD